MTKNDPFGQAISDYFEQGNAPDLIVNSNYTEDEFIPVKYLFRSFNEMSVLEKNALELCRGKVLDVGAAAGCHSVILQKKGVALTALELSDKACEVLKKRSVKNVICCDIFDYSEEKYDTILLLMNGAGIGKTIAGIEQLLLHLKNLLTMNGQILIDSSDIKYLFEEEDGSYWIDLNNKDYYGEMEYEVTYKNHKCNFKWLFVDFDKLSGIANKAGLKCELITSGTNSDYLAKITK